MIYFGRRLQALLASPLFFWGIILFFILEALWFVFFMAYPMAFDEEYHFGVIKVYTQQWWPLLGQQPPGTDVFGSLARDPSYLFHYIMSFPYRLLEAVLHNEKAVVIALRLINVAMFVGGLVLFRRVLRQLHTPPALLHTIFAVMVLVPIVPWLAGTLNYDNLLFLMLPWLCLLAFKVHQSFVHRTIDIQAVILFITGCMAVALVKYAALPLLIGLVLYLLVSAYRAFRPRFSRFISQLSRQAKKLSPRLLVLLLVPLLVVGGLFFERYAGNIIAYHHPAPECDVVLGPDRCAAYGPWARNHSLAQTKGDFDTSPIIYLGQWLYGMWDRSFFAVSGPLNDYETKVGLPMPAYSAIVLGLAGFITICLYFRRIFSGKPLLQMMLVMSLTYLGLLWANLYGSYLATGEPVAINGRYLIPLLPIFGIIIGKAFSLALVQHRLLKPYVAIAAITLFTCGGGVFTFMVLASPSWYW